MNAHTTQRISRLACLSYYIKIALVGVLLPLPAFITESYGDTIHHVGYQDCGDAPPNSGSWFDGALWLNYVVPDGDDEAWLGTVGDEHTHNIYFGDFCVEVGCPSAYDVAGGLAQASHVRLQSGTWVFDFDTGSTGGCTPGSSSGDLTVGEFWVGYEADPNGPTPIADLTVRGDGTLTTMSGNGFLVADATGSIGSVVITGEAAAVSVSNILSIAIGEDSIGTLDVVGGARLSIGTLGIVGGGGDGLLRIADPGSLCETSAQMWVCNGSDSRGELVIENGGHFATSNYVGVGNGAADSVFSRGSLVISGPGSTVTDLGGSFFIIGAGRDGDLTIEDNAQMDTAYMEFGQQVGVLGEGVVQNDATVTISGSLDIGWDGDGVVEVRTGASVHASGHVGIGIGSESESSVFVTGPGTSLTAEQGLTIGGAWFEEATGSGDLTIANAAEVVSGPYLVVAERGHGTTLVRTGGRLLLSGGGDVWIGLHEGAMGDVTVRNAGSEISGFGLLRVGGSYLEGETGTGTMTIEDGGIASGGSLVVGDRGNGTVTVRTGGQLLTSWGHIAESAGSTGAVILDGANSMWSASDSVTVGIGGVGMLTLLDASLFTGTYLGIAENGTLAGTGVVAANTTNTGRVVPGGETIGSLTVDGTFFQLEAGITSIQLAGVIPGEGYDRLLMTDAVVFGGTLEVSTLDDFDPEVGQIFEIMSFPSGSGAFDAIVLPMLDGGRCVQVAYSSTALTVTIQAGGSIGDVDGDCDADLDDFSMLASCLLGPGIPTGQGCEVVDFDTDDDVDLIDFAQFQIAFGN